MPTIRRMEGRAKVTKEVLCEEARFILANVMAEARYGRQNKVEDIRRVCEGAVSIPFGEYVGFLEKSGYLRQDQTSETLEVTSEGEQVVNGGNLTEFTERAVSHFKKIRQQRAPGSQPPPPGVAASDGDTSSRVISPPPPLPASVGAATPPPVRKDATGVRSSGGHASMAVRGEIQN